MKVVILANNDIGLYRFRKELIQELLNRQYQVYISLPYGKAVEDLVKMGCIFIDTLIERRGTNPVKDLKLIFYYNYILSKINPDVVLTYTIKPNIYGGFVCGRKNIRYLANITGLGTSIEKKGFLSEIILGLYKTGLKRADMVFFQNETNQLYFQTKKIISGSSILLCGSGVNLEDNPYEVYPKEQRIIHILFVGRIMREKGINELLQCAEQIRREEKDVYFDLVGGFDDESFKTIIEDLQHRSIVQYHGQQEDVHSFMKQSHAVILPSYHEGLSNVLLEAAACGRPILASRVPGCVETYEDGVTGIGFNARDKDSMIEAIKKFLNLSREQREEMGRMGRKKIEREFDRRYVIDAYMNVIDENWKGELK